MFKILITMLGGIGIVVTTKQIIVELNSRSFLLFIICAAIFAIGLIQISKETNKKIKSGYESLKKRKSDPKL